MPDHPNATDILSNGVLELQAATGVDEVLRWAWFVANTGENCCLAAIRSRGNDDATSLVLTAADVFAGCRSALEASEAFDPVTAMIEHRTISGPTSAIVLTRAAAALSTTCTHHARLAGNPSDAMALWAVAGMAYAATVALAKAETDVPLGW